MAHTNSTTNYNLPQFLPTDKPAWLVDVNPAYASIDTAIKNASDAAGNAQGDATQALADAAGANAIATQANTKADGAIASLAENFLDTATYAVGEYVIFNNILYVCTEPVTTPGPWTGSVNWARASVDSIATSFNTDINVLKDRTGSDIPVSDDSTGSIADAINANKWVDASSEFTAGPSFDSDQNSIILYNAALKMYYLCFAVKSNSTDNTAIFTNCPRMGVEVMPLTCGAANFPALTPTQYSAVYLRGNGTIWFRTSQTVNVPIFVQGFLYKA